MRKFTPLLFAGTLAACSAAQIQTVSQDFVNAVDAGTVAACAYLPEFNAVANVFAALSYVGTVQQVVDAICAGAVKNVAALQSRRRLSVQQSTFTIIVNGQPVVITGHYVN